MSLSSTESNRVVADEYLDLHIKAARHQFDAECVEDSARRLREKLSLTRRTRRPSFNSLLKRAFNQTVGWTSFAGTALILVVAISLASVFFPQGNGAALAQIQQWFTSFRTLQVEATVVEEDTVIDVITWFDETGDTRIESRGTTTIVKPEENMIYFLQPDGQNFAQRITSDMAIVENSTAFLDVIQTFLEAERLTESQVINGVSAIGYKRESDERTIVLWVDPADNRPLLVESERPDGVTIRSVLNFNVPLPANAFDVPDEVQLIEPR